MAFTGASRRATARPPAPCIELPLVDLSTSEVVPHPQLQAVVVLLLAVLRAPLAHQRHAPEAELQVGARAVRELGDHDKAPIDHVDDRGHGGGEVEDVEGLLLARARVENTPPWGWAA